MPRCYPAILMTIRMTDLTVHINDQVNYGVACWFEVPGCVMSSEQSESPVNMCESDRHQKSAGDERACGGVVWGAGSRWRRWVTRRADRCADDGHESAHSSTEYTRDESHCH